jgi:hypothetical protein
VGATAQIRLSTRRRELRRVVIAALSACVLILVAAGVVRVVHASSEPDRSARTPAVAPPANANPVATQPIAAQSPSPATSSGASALATTPAAGGSDGLNVPTAGTLRLERNVTPRFVLLDGKKLTTHNEVVSCGPHTIKVGHARPRAIDVPCGGELRISR